MTGALNSETSKVNNAKNHVTRQWDTVRRIASYYYENNKQWIIIGDHEYGGGPRNDYAALESRYLGGLAVIARSFARDHETDLKKQGMLPLTFINPDDYNKVLPNDNISILGLDCLAPGENLTLIAKHEDGQQSVRGLPFSAAFILTVTLRAYLFPILMTRIRSSGLSVVPW